MTDISDYLSVRDGARNVGYRDGSADRPTGRGDVPTTAGEASRNAKLTEAKVLDILSRPTTGPERQSHATLAAEFGVSRQQISGIRSGRFWSHLRRRAVS